MSSTPSPNSEKPLAGVSVSGLNDLFLNRLVACSDGSWIQLTPDEIEFEQRLRSILPSSLQISLISTYQSLILPCTQLELDATEQLLSHHLHPAPLSHALLRTIEFTYSQDWPADLKQFEHFLKTFQPSSLAPHLLSELTSHVAAQTPVTSSNVISFPTEHSRNSSKWMASAAAVALIGAVTALMLPQQAPQQAPLIGQISNHLSSPTPATIEVSPASQAADADSNRNNFIPAGLNRKVTETKDEGIVWQSDHQAHRVLKVVYLETITMKAPDGSSYQVERPHVEYIYTPQEAN